MMLLERWRNSAIKSFAKCPQAFKWEYLEGQAKKESIEAFTGTQAHHALDYMHLQILLFGGVTLKEVLDHYTDQYGQNWGPQVFIAETAKEQNSNYYFEMGQDCITHYFNTYEAGGTGLWDASEETQYLERTYKGIVGGYEFQGTVDRVAWLNGVLHIHDYKTGKAKPTKAELAVSQQLSIYALLASKHHNYKGDVYLHLHYLQHQKLYTEIRTQDQIQGINAEVEQVISEIEEAQDLHHWPAKVGNLCGWCPFYKTCTQYQESKMKDFNYV